MADNIKKAKSVILNDEFGYDVYPFTKETLIYDDNGVKLSDKIITYEVLFDEEAPSYQGFMNLIANSINRITTIEAKIRKIDSQIQSVEDDEFMTAVYEIFPIAIPL